MTDDTGQAPTTDRLRRDIDAGRTGDKVAHPDPAAAPLGTDDEAAGTPPDDVRREAARPRDEAVASAPGPDERHEPARPALPIALGLLSLALLVLFVLSRGN